MLKSCEFNIDSGCVEMRVYFAAIAPLARRNSPTVTAF